MYRLTLAWIDGGGRESVELGALSHRTRAAQKKSWSAVPAAAAQTPFFLELRDKTRSLMGAKSVSANTVEALLGERVETLLARGRRKTLSTVAIPNLILLERR